ncbi:hypothetical protein NDU88_004401 [Pleurodeles waltl]|uniref:Uncharacterized protein n=1 Tax=Pleurodeles waltl TaxID=8319 RepID=A0AAV7QFS9_PLEWA|nr:hypothetical protein NDU88_004401 [Pleurodeles waltl]
MQLPPGAGIRMAQSLPSRGLARGLRPDATVKVARPGALLSFKALDSKTRAASIAPRASEHYVTCFRGEHQEIHAVKVGASEHYMLQNKYLAYRLHGVERCLRALYAAEMRGLEVG